MNITGWTLAQRMRFPEWCFPNRQLVSAYGYNDVVASHTWAISTIALPDPAVIWEFDYWCQPNVASRGDLRLALADVVPANTADMDAALEIFPDYGIIQAGPNKIPLNAELPWYIMHRVKKGMVTGGKYLVTETRCGAGVMRTNVALLVSGLPTDMAGWMEHSRV